MNEEVEESVIYDDESIGNSLNETVAYVKKELERLKQIKLEYELKIKIAVDIDDTILSTKELEEYYWNIFFNNILRLIN